MSVVKWKCKIDKWKKKKDLKWENSFRNRMTLIDEKIRESRLSWLFSKQSDHRWENSELIQGI